MDVRFFALDIAVICTPAFVLYYPCHRRKDLAVISVGVNIRVLAVTTVLATATVGAGLGLGLFGVLSIICLRSSELSQVEAVYYFAALAIGLIGGLGSGMPSTMVSALIGGIVFALVVVDSRRAISGSRHMAMVADRTIGDAGEFVRFIEARMGMTAREMSVARLDHASDSTMVDVRCDRKTAAESARPRNLRVVW